MDLETEESPFTLEVDLSSDLPSWVLLLVTGSKRPWSVFAMP